MEILDLFCGAGGAGTGYMRAGHRVTGVDIAPQPAYPGRFVAADALEYLVEHGAGFDLVHASPPCQGYSPHVSSRSSTYAGTRGQDEPRLIADVRSILERLGVPYVIENVAGARPELVGPIMLCGTMFGLPIPRHRLIESRGFILPVTPGHAPCKGVARRYAADRGWEYRDMSVTGKGRHAGTLDRWREIMGWPEYTGTQHGMREAIPPAYAEWIGGGRIG